MKINKRNLPLSLCIILLLAQCSVHLLAANRFYYSYMEYEPLHQYRVNEWKSIQFSVKRKKKEEQITLNNNPQP